MKLNKFLYIFHICHAFIRQDKFASSQSFINDLSIQGYHIKQINSYKLSESSNKLFQTQLNQACLKQLLPKSYLQIASFMKLLIQLSPSNSYHPTKYYECTYLLNPHSDILINFSHPQLLILCDHCQTIMYPQDISVLVEQLTLNQRPYSDLCLRCLYKLINAKTTPKGKYYVRTRNVFSIRSADWGLFDEMLLLKGIEKHGYNNWGNISVWMQSHGSFLNEKCFEYHFVKYLLAKKHPSFDDQINLKQCTQERRQVYKKPYYLQKSTQKTLEKPKLPLKRKQIQEDTLTSTDTISFQQKYDQINREDRIKSQQQSRLAIYTPERDEFLIEYDCLAQSLIANLEFSPDDSPAQTELKQQLLIKYNDKLKERLIKKKFVIQEDLLHHVEQSPVKEKTKKTVSKKGQNKQSLKKNQKGNFSSGIFESTSLTENHRCLENFIDSSRRYFIDEKELNQTKQMALDYIKSRTILHTLKTMTQTSQKKKCKNIKDLIKQVGQKINKVKQQQFQNDD